MLISQAIANIKSFCLGVAAGKPIDGATTRDQILWGDSEQELTGVVTCIWASADVIREAAVRGANLIVSHEALFWNHGDHTDWLEKQGNETFLAKRALLEEHGICVWRFHDFIHSGVPVRLFDGWAVQGLAEVEATEGWTDGIFAPLAAKLGYTPLPEMGPGILFCGCEVDGITAHELAQELVEKLGLTGTRIEGDPTTVVHRAAVAMHLLGYVDNQVISLAARHNIDCLLCMDRTDYTAAQWVRDSCQLGRKRAIIDVGHFNIEEPGMEACAGWLSEAIGDANMPVSFVSAGDPFTYVQRG
ncbi:MAG: Nif3-like dinuclear metal center hexameric protein [Atopobiaceae bacterium]|nr:Nif3-like dinuclear metal center hexameric protein [Atopobiaceae bacterium]